jgi:hypothetical protein
VLRFDYGAPLFQTYDAALSLEALGEYGSFYEMAPDYALDDISYCEDRFSAPDVLNVYPGARYDMKVSMYLEILPAAYTRTVIQGVRLTESRKLAGDYKRGAAETVRGAAEVKGFGGGYRGIAQAVTNTMGLKRFPTLVRKLGEAVTALYDAKTGAGFKRGMYDSAGTGSVMGGMGMFFRTLSGQGGSGDSTGSFIARMRFVADAETVEDGTGYRGDYLRGLFAEAGNSAETVRRGGYCRDGAGGGAVSLRHLFVFIRLLTGGFIRDYITGRFLKSKEETVLKSAVCREIRLESKIR